MHRPIACTTQQASPGGMYSFDQDCRSLDMRSKSKLERQTSPDMSRMVDRQAYTIQQRQTIWQAHRGGAGRPGDMPAAVPPPHAPGGACPGSA